MFILFYSFYSAANYAMYESLWEKNCCNMGFSQLVPSGHLPSLVKAALSAWKS